MKKRATKKPARKAAPKRKRSACSLELSARAKRQKRAKAGTFKRGWKR